jgi:hypothetical protein
MNKLAALILISLGSWASSAHADLIYATTAISASPRTSDYGTTTGAGFRTYDNFSSTSDAIIQRISWSGIWFADAQPAAAPAPIVDSWQIGFYSSNAGAPDAALWAQSIASANVASTFLGTGTLSAGTVYNVNFYDYSVDLPSDFGILAGVEYWISVTAISDTFSPAFAIRGATGGDGESYQETLGASMSVISAAQVARDRALTIEGALLAVPEPGTIALAGLALAALGVARRRPKSMALAVALTSTTSRRPARTTA